VGYNSRSTKALFIKLEKLEMAGLEPCVGTFPKILQLSSEMYQLRELHNNIPLQQ